MKFTAAKAKAAAVMATLTALGVATQTVQTVLDDNVVDTGEISVLVGIAVTLVGTVWAVWRVPNEPLSSGNSRT